MFAPKFELAFSLGGSGDFNHMGRCQRFYPLVKYSTTYILGTRRFDVGEKCTSTVLSGVIAALEQIMKWGASIAESIAQIKEMIAIMRC